MIHRMASHVTLGQFLSYMQALVLKVIPWEMRLLKAGIEPWEMRLLKAGI